MFGQYQAPGPSAAKWIFAGFAAVILMAFGLGLNIKDAKWFNPDIAAAEASLMNIEAAHQKATNELQERLATAQTEADIREIQRRQGMLDAQYQNNIQALSQNLAHQDLAFRTLMALLTMIAGVLAAALFVNTVVWTSSKALVVIRSVQRKEEPVMKSVPQIEKRIPNLPERKPYDPWNSPAYRRSKRTAARQAEREEIAARMMNFRDPARMSTEEYNRNPEAK